MAILITGGAGFVGSNLVDKLLLQKRAVVCIDNFDDFYAPKIKEHNISSALSRKDFKLYRGDIREKRWLSEIFKSEKVETVIHLAAKTNPIRSVKEPESYISTNVWGTTSLLEVCKDYSVKVIFASSSSVYGNTLSIPFKEDDLSLKPVSPYGASKLAAEVLCQTYNKIYAIPILILRLFSVYGPRQRPDMAIHKFTKYITEGREITVYGSGKAERDHTYIDDILKGIIRAIDKKFNFEIINLGDSNPIELDYIITLLEESLNKRAKVKKQKRLPKGDVKITYADIEKAKKFLDYSPEVKIEEGIKRFVDWYIGIWGRVSKVIENQEERAYTISFKQE